MSSWDIVDSICSDKKMFIASIAALYALTECPTKAIFSNTLSEIPVLNLSLDAYG